VKVSDLKCFSQPINSANYSKPKIGGEEAVYCIQSSEAERDGRTTLMLRNIPNKYTQEMVLQEVESAGLAEKYDFFYLPIDFKVRGT
jgi:hypothetical protein